MEVLVDTAVWDALCGKFSTQFPAPLLSWLGCLLGGNFHGRATLMIDIELYILLFHTHSNFSMYLFYSHNLPLCGQQQFILILILRSWERMIM